MSDIDVVCPCCHWGSSLKGSVVGALSLSRIIYYAFFVTICTIQPASAADTSVSYTGVNIAGGEFAPGKRPGIYNRDYTYPDSLIHRLLRGQGNEYHSCPRAVGADSASIGQ